MYQNNIILINTYQNNVILTNFDSTQYQAKLDFKLNQIEFD